MALRNKLYKLTDGDKAIFAAARAERNPSRISNYYMRNDDSGTYFRPVSDKQMKMMTMKETQEFAARLKSNYESLHAIWKHLKKPDFFGPNPFDPEDWRTWTEDEYEKMRASLDTVYRSLFDPGDAQPYFQLPHGVKFIPWQLEMDRAKQPLLVVPGGKGSSKTYGKVLSVICRGLMLPGYHAAVIAPTSRQSEEFFAILMEMIEGTMFEQFVVSSALRPRPKLVWGHNGVGKSVLECFSGEDPGNLLTLTLDEVVVDQAEKFDGTSNQFTIDGLIPTLGTRFRGTIRGRSRLGQITFLANSADNPDLWDLADRAADEPDYIWAYEPNTFENLYLTIDDLVRFEQMMVDKGQDFKDQHFFGKRPVGSGEHFPASSLNKCRSEEMSSEMTDNLNRETEGWSRLIQRKVDVHRWERPYEEGSTYMVVADPGWNNPPARDSAAIGVFKIDNFPAVPAVLVAFDWVFGNHSPSPWIARYIEYVHKYHALGFNGFDSTGLQSGYEHIANLSLLMPMPITLNGAKKYTYLNLTKNFFAEGLYRIPSDITHLFSQFSKYKLPDENIKQDIVSMFFIATAILEPLYMVALEATKTAGSDAYYGDQDDRYFRPPSDRDYDPMFGIRESA